MTSAQSEVLVQPRDDLAGLDFRLEQTLLLGDRLEVRR
jgi:hypothetical protein